MSSQLGSVSANALRVKAAGVSAQQMNVGSSLHIDKPGSNSVRDPSGIFALSNKLITL